MSVSSGGVADLVLKRILKEDIGKLTLNGDMLNVLISLDGKKTLGQVAQQTGMSLVDIRPIVVELAKKKLIAKVEQTVDVVDADFVNYVTSMLSRAIGPLGAIVLEDGIEDLGYTKQTFPQKRCAELVNLLAQEIQREDKRIEFKEQMLTKIREKGY